MEYGVSGLTAPLFGLLVMVFRTTRFGRCLSTMSRISGSGCEQAGSAGGVKAHWLLMENRGVFTPTSLRAHLQIVTATCGWEPGEKVSSADTTDSSLPPILLECQ